MKRLIQSLYHGTVGIVLFCYYRLPSKLRRVISPGVKVISLRLKLLLMLVLQFRRECFMIHGRKKNSEMRILYIGQKTRLSHILQSASLEESAIKEHKKIFLWETRKTLRSGMKNSDLIIVEVNPLLAKRAQKAGLILIPEWVSFFMKTTAALSELIKNSGRSLKENMRRVKSYKFSYELSTDPEKFIFFYHRMYIPYISKRYSQLAYLRNFHLLRSLFSAGAILFVTYNGEYIAGNILAFRDGTLRSSCVGILDGDEGYLKKGVISALNYFILEWAARQNFKMVDFGLSMAFLNDGVFLYKKNWGMTVKKHEYTTTFWGLKVCRFNEGVCNFLENNPFVFDNNGELEGLVFIKNESPVGMSEIRQVYKTFWTDGLSKLNLLSSSGFVDIFIDSECRDLCLVSKDFLAGHARV